MGGKRKEKEREKLSPFLQNVKKVQWNCMIYDKSKRALAIPRKSRARQER